MPLRSFSSPLASARLQRLFHTSAVRRDGRPNQNHYETLQIPTNATPSEVKKSFYALSKTHHPDRNPSDPNASQRFVQISEAYATLGTPAKRQQYDRDLHLHSSHHSHPHARPHGSYHSSGPAGGRPASGLSRRRTQFRGPPPSFYRSGGWGEHSAKRKAAQDTGAPGAEAPPSSGGGMGPGQMPFGHGEENNIPHFDREGHLNTQRRQSERWQRRKGMEEGYVPSGEAPRGMLANFLFVGGIISLGVFVPSFLFERIIRRKGKEER